MNREIKFRGKRIDNGEWVYGGVEQNSITIIYDDTLPYDNETLVYKETVGQFTGLFDKNGKEIYEGDIVNLVYENDEDVYVIEWCNITSRFEIKSKTLSVDFDNYYSNELEVIGNIHDNSELLNEVGV